MLLSAACIYKHVSVRHSAISLLPKWQPIKVRKKTSAVLLEVTYSPLSSKRQGYAFFQFWKCYVLKPHPAYFDQGLLEGQAVEKSVWPQFNNQETHLDTLVTQHQSIPPSLKIFMVWSDRKVHREVIKKVKRAPEELNRSLTQEGHCHIEHVTFPLCPVQWQSSVGFCRAIHKQHCEDHRLRACTFGSEREGFSHVLSSCHPCFGRNPEEGKTRQTRAPAAFWNPFVQYLRPICIRVCLHSLVCKMGAKPFAARVPLASGLWDSAKSWVLGHQFEVWGRENVEKTGFLVSWQVGCRQSLMGSSLN